MPSIINERIVADLPAPAAGNRLHYFSGATLQGKKAPAGFAVRVTSAGCKSFVWFHRVNRRPFLETIGTWSGNDRGGTHTVLQAIIAAKARADAVAHQGADPRPARTRHTEDAHQGAGDTVEMICREYLAREGKRLRTVIEREQILGRLIYPTLGKRPIGAVTRSEIIRMCDKIEDANGPRMADVTLAALRRVMSWHAARSDDFRSPIVRGMMRQKPSELARSRILTDDELRAVWKTADAGASPHHALIKFLLLTAARRGEGAELTWSEIDGADWTLPASRNKTKVDLVRPLSSPAIAVIELRRHDDSGPFVFSTRGATPPGGFSRFKEKFDLACGVTGWSWHDLRRTARSLMARAGVREDHAERCLGHVIGGVRGTYDRHRYRTEMLNAFEALATLIARIVDPPQDNVEQLRRA